MNSFHSTIRKLISAGLRSRGS
uniref:Uncharacterized protein n=1 Tax=Anguilla anguilla TaxID=7936 RepID=A0A0E9SPX4_ANGAN